VSSPDARTRLEAQQAELVRALTGQGPAPARFDRQRVEAAALSLLRKRLRGVAEVWPGLSAALGERFAEHFLAYARSTPLPRSGSALADGRAFARHLEKSGELPEEGREEAFAVDLRYVATADGMVPRRGIVVKMGRFRQRFVVALRGPWIGERWLTLLRLS
jgi:hypothetical protein